MDCTTSECQCQLAVKLHAQSQHIWVALWISHRESGTRLHIAGIHEAIKHRDLQIAIALKRARLRHECCGASQTCHKFMLLANSGQWQTATVRRDYMGRAHRCNVQHSVLVGCSDDKQFACFLLCGQPAPSRSLHTATRACVKIK